MRLLPLAAMILAVSPLRAQDAPKCGTCDGESYGTTIEWAGSPDDAATRAKKEEKLVFVLHVSGYFEDPKFT